MSDGGVPKGPVSEATVTPDGVAGDRQRDLHIHGGERRAVTLFSLERIQALRAEGHPIDVGTTGENLTVAGLDWDAVVPGCGVRVGGVRLEITKFASPCAGIAGSFAGGAYERLSQKRHAGWSRVCARVIEGGRVASGDAVELLPTTVSS